LGGAKSVETRSREIQEILDVLALPAERGDRALPSRESPAANPVAAVCV